MRRSDSLSPMVAILSVIVSATVLPPRSVALSASISSAFSAASAICATIAWKSAFLATKSVSALTSTATPLPPETLTATRPSAAVRPDFLAALASPLVRSQSTAASMSPPVSVSAFFASIIPAPVLSRSSFTCAAVIAISALLDCSSHRGARPAVRQFGVGARARAPETGSGLGLRLCRFGLGRGFTFLGHRLLDEGFLHLAHVDARGVHLRRHPVESGAADQIAIQADRARGVVVAGDDVINAVGGAVGVDHGDHRDAQLPRLGHREILAVDVDHEQKVGQAAHLADAAERGVELGLVTLHVEAFLLGQALDAERHLLVDRLQ